MMRFAASLKRNMDLDLGNPPNDDDDVDDTDLEGPEGCKKGYQAAVALWRM